MLLLSVKLPGVYGAVRCRRDLAAAPSPAVTAVPLNSWSRPNYVTGTGGLVWGFACVCPGGGYANILTSLPAILRDQANQRQWPVDWNSAREHEIVKAVAGFMDWHQKMGVVLAVPDHRVTAVVLLVPARLYTNTNVQSNTIVWQTPFRLLTRHQLPLLSTDTSCSATAAVRAAMEQQHARAAFMSGQFLSGRGSPTTAHHKLTAGRGQSPALEPLAAGQLVGLDQRCV